jgi:uncharacterized protein YdeI (BOF family)
MLALATVSVLAVALAAPALAQTEREPTTISAIQRGDASGEVFLVGSALFADSDDEYVFSDGSGTIALEVDRSDDLGPLPLFELIGLVGEVDGGEVEVSSWEFLPIMTPAVIVPEEQVIADFQGWIVSYGSQEPAE